MSFTQYVRFLLVGGFVAVLTIGAREVIARVLGHDSAINFSISVALAYALGITLSYLLNHRFTFRGNSKSTSKGLALFVVVALVGMALTWLLSLALRYGTPIESIAGKYSGMIAFGSAALLASLITYPLNAKLVFRARAHAGTG